AAVDVHHGLPVAPFRSVSGDAPACTRGIRGHGRHPVWGTGPWAVSDHMGRCTSGHKGVSIGHPVSVSPRHADLFGFRFNVDTEELHVHTFPNGFQYVVGNFVGYLEEDLVVYDANHIRQKSGIFDVDKAWPKMSRAVDWHRYAIAE